MLLRTHGEAQENGGSTTHTWKPRTEQIGAKVAPLSSVQKHGGALHPQIQTTLKEELERVDSAAKDGLWACTGHGRARSGPRQVHGDHALHGGGIYAAAGMTLTMAEDTRRLRDGRNTRGSP